MIIGIAGKKQSGKDTVAMFINYIATGGHATYVGETVEEKLKGFIKFYKDGLEVDAYPWIIKRFADKLKDIVCLLTGCTREDLENEEFKNSHLNGCWKQIISINTDRDIISLENGYSHSTGLYVDVEYTPTYREILQYIGTNLFRNQFHSLTWINATMVDYNYHSNWIIPDVRFPDEVEAIKERGGIVIRINRKTNLKDNHDSETALDNYSGFDHIIDNNHSLVFLYNELYNVIKNITL